MQNKLHFLSTMTGTLALLFSATPGLAQTQQMLNATADVCRDVTPTITGTPGNDVINGTNGADIIFGLGGDDTIRGRGGDDIICGGDGADKIYGNNGADQLFGGRGSDEIYGNANQDIILGGPGHDKIDSGWGRDTVRGGPGNDQIWGDLDGDIIIGGFGDDELWGRNGDDTVFGGPGNDLVCGNNGNDTLHGDDDPVTTRGRQTARDIIVGDTLRDVIAGGRGDDFIVTDVTSPVGGDSTSDQVRMPTLSAGGIALGTDTCVFQFLPANGGVTPADSLQVGTCQTRISYEDIQGAIAQANPVFNTLFNQAERCNRITRPW